MSDWSLSKGELPVVIKVKEKGSEYVWRVMIYVIFRVISGYFGWFTCGYEDERGSECVQRVEHSLGGIGESFATIYRDVQHILVVT